ncbi:substrate-binding periplasmic protein [Psychromonas ossibalaenae]|uniref:substrate-binding periplasmic protein n=1 Tax=Psychromonas ossibalaenae TaxID=444922 RepID=UPI00037BB6AF|nr:transporter substrate-binding domain-containing protein [Psychromonas ossibalaenae]
MKTNKVLIFLVFVVSFNSSLFANDFIILGTNDPPLKYFEGDRSNVKGIAVDILKEALGEMGINPVFRIVDSDLRIQKELRNGNAQMAMLYSYRQHREKYFIYSTEAIIRLSWHFFYRTEDINKIHYDSFDDFKNLQVGIVNGITYTNEFMNSGLSFSNLPKKGSELEMLVKHRIDLIALPTFITLTQINNKGFEDKITYLKKPLKSRLYYNVFGNNNDQYDMRKLISIYDHIIKKMKANGRIRQIFIKHLGNDIDLDVLLN